MTKASNVTLVISFNMVDVIGDEFRRSYRVLRIVLCYDFRRCGSSRHCLLLSTACWRLEQPTSTEPGTGRNVSEKEVMRWRLRW